MSTENKTPLIKIFQGLAGLLVLGIFSFVYRGFFYPDLYTLGRWPGLCTFLLWGFRLGLPVFAVGIVFLVFGIREKRIKTANLILLIISIIFSFVLLFSAMQILYDHSFNNNPFTRSFHPFLQLTPPETEPDRLKENPFTIFCLGGSTTEFKDSQNRGWPVRLEKELRSHFKNRDIEVFNHGRQWYTTLHTLIHYETNIRPLCPDIILVMHSINDLLHNADFSYFSHGPFRADYGHFYGPVNRLVNRESFLRFLFRRIAGLWYHKDRDVVSLRQFPGLKIFEQNLNTLIDLAESDGVRIVFLSQPNIYSDQMTAEVMRRLYMLNFEAIGPDKKWDAETVKTGLEMYSAALQSIAMKRGIPFIDVKSHIPKSLKYFYDDVHYKDQTFDLVAEYIADHLLPFIDEKQNRTAVK